MNRQIFNFLILSAFVICSLSVAAAPVFAQEAADEKAEQPAEQAEPVDPEAEKKKEKYNRAAEAAYGAVKEIGKDLKDADAKHFYMIYQNYNLIGSVKVVKEDVQNAVKACGENNPDMKSDIDARFNTWNSEISGILTEAEANIDNMIIAQDYAEPAKIRGAFAKLDKAREATNAAIDKRPVTSPEACKFLREKMDETQENLSMLLRSTLISFGAAFPETGEAVSGQQAAETEEKPPADEPKED